MSCRRTLSLAMLTCVANVFVSAAAWAGDSAFSLTYLGRSYDPQNDETTFSYELCWDGTAPGLSHFMLGASECRPPLDVINPPEDGLIGCGDPGDPAIDNSTDPDGPQGPGLGFFGFKWDNCSNFPSGGCDTFTITVDGNRGETQGEWLAKAGNCNVGTCDGGITTIPDCEGGNLPPVCNAGGPYYVECGMGTGMVMLDGTGSYDPDGNYGDDDDDFPAGQIGGLFYQWSTDCPDGTLDDPNSPTPTLTLTTVHPNGQDLSCKAYLTVYDPYEASDKCMAVVNIGECDFDCEGTPGGEAELDECGVCEGGNADKDDCGVCFGNNEDKDECGICFGMNEDKDVCGVCFGDGTTCEPVCEESDITETQAALDGLGEEQRKVVKKSSVFYQRAGGKKNVAEAAREEANALYMDNWSVIWSMDSIVQINCTNAEFCVETSNVATIESYNVNASELYSLGKKMTKRLKRQLKKAGKPVGRANRLAKKNDKLFADTQSLAGQVPTSTLSCN